MALINIEYGSLASSDTMNKNFIYLEDKIAESSESILTTISSIYSNIATINARLNDLTEQLEDSLTELNDEVSTKISDYKTKINTAINEVSLVPDWNNRVQIDKLKDYTAPSNGYLFTFPSTTSGGTITINGATTTYKLRVNENDNAAQVVPIPVQKGDVVSTTANLNYCYFVPAIQFTLEEEV